MVEYLSKIARGAPWVTTNKRRKIKSKVRLSKYESPLDPPDRFCRLCQMSKPGWSWKYWSFRRLF